MLANKNRSGLETFLVLMPFNKYKTAETNLKSLFFVHAWILKHAYKLL